MKPKEQLIQDACDAIDDLKGEQRRRAWEALHELVDRYRAACDISEGPDKSRAAHWTFKAKEIEAELRRRAL